MALSISLCCEVPLLAVSWFEKSAIPKGSNDAELILLLLNGVSPKTSSLPPFMDAPLMLFLEKLLGGFDLRAVSRFVFGGGATEIIQEIT